MVSRPSADAVDWTRGIPFVDSKVRESARRKKAEKRKMGWKPPIARRPSPSPTRRWDCSSTEKDSNWFDPGSFWSGDSLPLAPGYRLGAEIAVEP